MTATSELETTLRVIMADVESCTGGDEQRREHVLALRAAGVNVSDVLPLLTSATPLLRSFAVEVLQVPKNYDERASFLAELRRMIATERVPAVITSVIQALTEIIPEDIVDLVLPQVNSPAADVRQVAAIALGGSRDPRAVTALIALSSDESDEVRNWSVFGLGSMLGRPGDALYSTEELCDALAASLADTHEEIRAEASLGLAMRGDLRCLAVVKAALIDGTAWSHFVEAAYYLRATELCEPLRRLSEGLEDDEARAFWESERHISLTMAIMKCCSQ